MAKKKTSNNEPLELARITAKTQAQKDTVYAHDCGYNLLLQGSAGTGKTFLALFLALREVLENEYTRIVLIRSSVSTRDIGHLPGLLEDKLAVYEYPYQHIISELLPNKFEPYQYLKDMGMIEFHSTSYIRGRTFDDSVIVVDEAQNCSFHELDSIITRVGNNSKIMFAGDTSQTDLLKSSKDTCGLAKFSRIIEDMDEFAIVNFTRNDIVRSGLVKSYIISKEDILNE